MGKKDILFYLYIYKMILLQDLKSKMSYRSDFFISVIGMITTNISGFVVFWILFQNITSIIGWSYYEMLFLYSFSLLSLTPVQCFFNNNWNLQSHVYSGEFIKYCFRPINIFFYYISETFDPKGLGQFLFGFVVLIYSINKLGIVLGFFEILKIVISLATASLFMIAIMNIAAASSFWIVNSSIIMNLAYKLKDYAKYPISIFNPIFRFIFTFIVPIAFISYYPSLLFLRPYSIPVITYISPFIGIAWFWLSYKIWIKGAMSYTGTGS